MERKIDIISIEKLEKVPTHESIKMIPRERTMRLVFEKSVLNKRESVGQKLKNQLAGFQIGIHTIEPEINIAKLLTDQEIET